MVMQNNYKNTASALPTILLIISIEIPLKKGGLFCNTRSSTTEAKAIFNQELARSKWGRVIARGWATLLLDRPRDFVVAPFSVGGKSSSL